MNKAGYVRCATCVITRGVSYIRVFRWAFGDASIKTWIFRHATFFSAPSGGAEVRGRGRGKKMEDASEKNEVNKDDVNVTYE